jgi:hypothetical protein
MAQTADTFRFGNGKSVGDFCRSEIFDQDCVVDGVTTMEGFVRAHGVADSGYIGG